MTVESPFIMFQWHLIWTTVICFHVFVDMLRTNIFRLQSILYSMFLFPWFTITCSRIALFLVSLADWIMAKLGNSVLLLLSHDFNTICGMREVKYKYPWIFFDVDLLLLLVKLVCS